MDGDGEGVHAHRQREVRGGFERIGQAGFVLEEVERLGPFGPGGGIEVGANEAAMGFASVDDRREVDGTDLAGCFEDGRGQGGVAFGIEFVHVESGGLPILVDAKGEVEERLFFEPCDVGADLGGASVAIIAVEIVTAGGLAGVAGESGGIEARAEPEPGLGGEAVFGDEAAHGERSGGFVPVNSGRNVESGSPRGGCGGAAGEHGDAGGGRGVEVFEGPSMAMSLGEQVTEDRVDGDGLALVTGVITAEAQHGLSLAASTGEGDLGGGGGAAGRGEGWG